MGGSGRLGALGAGLHELGDFRINYFDINGRSYEVVPQADDSYQQTSEAIAGLYVTTRNGVQVPLSTVVEVEREVVPNDLTINKGLFATRSDNARLHR